MSIGTLYNHFPTRDALADAVVPDRMAVFDRVADAALAEADPWRGFTVLIEGLLAMQVEDSGQLRPDFTTKDLFAVVRMLSRAVREAAGAPPDEVRRCLGFLLDGVRA